MVTKSVIWNREKTALYIKERLKRLEQGGDLCFIFDFCGR